MSRKGQASMEYAYLLNPGDMRAALGQGDVANYRLRTIKSGDQVEVEAYPIHRPGSNSIRRRREAESCTSEAQAEVNRRNAEKKITRLLNANFTRKDISMTWTYETAPGSIEAAQKELTNGISRLRRLFKRLQAAGKIDAGSEFKYLYVSEYATREGEPVRVNMEDGFEAFGEKLWNALNADNKVSLFVRSIDLATGKTETKIYNKNK